MDDNDVFEVRKVTTFPTTENISKNTIYLKSVNGVLEIGVSDNAGESISTFIRQEEPVDPFLFV